MILTTEIWNLSILPKAAFPHAGTAWYIPLKIVLQLLTDTSSSSFLSDHGNKVGLMHNKGHRSNQVWYLGKDFGYDLFFDGVIPSENNIVSIVFNHEQPHR